MDFLSLDCTVEVEDDKKDPSGREVYEARQGALEERTTRQEVRVSNDVMFLFDINFIEGVRN
jgi:hypothetical protein